MAAADEHVAGDEGDISQRDDIDMPAFNQILEMDEPGDYEFSSSIVFGFFDQARDTFVEIEDAIKDEDLTKLSELGHFLKGSSATLGLIKVRDGCELIQQYGRLETANSDKRLTEDQALSLIVDVFDGVRRDYRSVEAALRAYYDRLLDTNEPSEDA